MVTADIKVDAAYRTDLREINELNFARFDANLEQRLACPETWMAQFGAKQEQRFSEFRAELSGRMERLAVEAAEGRTAHTRWMFVAWATLLIPIIGLWAR